MPRRHVYELHTSDGGSGYSEYKYNARTLYTLCVQRAACGCLKVAITLKVKFERSVRSRERSGLSRPPSFYRQDRTQIGPLGDPAIIFYVEVRL